MKPARDDRRQQHALPLSTTQTGNRIGARLIWITVVVAALLIPIYYVPAGKDPFRFPKEILLRAEAMMIVAIALAWPWRLPIAITKRERVIILYVLAVVAWTVAITITSTHRTLSLESLARVAALAIIFIATYVLARGKSLLAILAVIAPACVNAADYIVLSVRQGTLFRIATLVDRPFAFLGNANDIGAFFVAPALACVSCAAMKPGGRLWPAIGAVLIVFAIVATQTLTPVIAFGAGLLVFVVVRWRQRAVAISAVVLVSAAATVLLYPPLATRVRVAVFTARYGNLNQSLSGRLIPFYAAWRMFRDRPIVGVGPGSFGWQYFPYKLEVARDHPALLESTGYALNFGEAHNDHLQTLATGGLPAYALLIGALGLVARVSFRRESSAASDQNSRFARTFALPFVASFVVLALTSFPLEMGATTSSQLFLAALIVRWGE